MRMEVPSGAVSTAAGMRRSGPQPSIGLHAVCVETGQCPSNHRLRISAWAPEGARAHQSDVRWYRWCRILWAAMRQARRYRRNRIAPSAPWPCLGSTWAARFHENNRIGTRRRPCACGRKSARLDSRIKWPDGSSHPISLTHRAEPPKFEALNQLREAVQMLEQTGHDERRRRAKADC